MERTTIPLALFQLFIPNPATAPDKTVETTPSIF